MIQKKERDSNLELLRIVAMCFIVLHHFIVHGYQLSKLCAGYHSIFPVKNQVDSFLLLTGNSFFITGVNLFILISGYYAIKLKWKSVFSLFAICLFYDYVQLYLADLVTNHAFEFYFSPVLQIFTRSGWFITCYIALMLFSPVINKATEYFSKKEKIYVLLGLCVLNLWYGFQLRSNLINENGYNFVQFIFIYYIGRCLKSFENEISLNVWKSITGYFVSSTLIAAIVVLMYSIKDFGPLWEVFNYNNPLVIISAVFLFLIFKRIRIKSRFINWCSASILAVYLIHESTLISKPLYKYIADINTGYTFFSVTKMSILLGLFCTIIFGSILIDKVRMLITNPIVTWCSLKAEKIQKLLENKIQNKRMYKPR
jgi:hypothetical protein